MNEILRQCTRCFIEKPLSEFGNQKGGKYGKYSRCKICNSEIYKEWKVLHPGYSSQWNHNHGISRPMSEAKDSNTFLGVYVAERVLREYFNTVKLMPHNNPGFDFICGKGYKIDCKSACLRIQPGNRAPSWTFVLNRNQTADYFMCLAFDNRESLNPLHIWLIPGNVINNQARQTISNIDRCIAKWKRYERPIDTAIGCCDSFKDHIHGV